MEKKMARDSNLELLRILCMLLIIADHATGQSGIAASGSYGRALAFSLLGCGSRFACDVFVFIGAWFMCAPAGPGFRTRRPLSLWLTLLLYTVPVTLICLVAGLPVTMGDLRWAVFPISTRQLWFISDYFVLLLLSPLLHRALDDLPRQAHRAILLVFGALLVGYPTLFATNGVVGDSAWAFGFLYLLAAYLRRWPGNRAERLLSHPAVALGFGVGLPVALSALRAWLLWRGNTDGKMMQYAEFYRSGLLALPNLLTALALFYLFKGLALGHRGWINTLAGTTLGVYILHQVPVFYHFLWNGIFQAQAHQGSILYALFMVVATFAGCAAVEWLHSRFLVQPLQQTGLFRAACTKGDALAAQLAPQPVSKTENHTL